MTLNMQVHCAHFQDARQPQAVIQLFGPAFQLVKIGQLIFTIKCAAVDLGALHDDVEPGGDRLLREKSQCTGEVIDGQRILEILFGRLPRQQ